MSNYTNFRPSEETLFLILSREDVNLVAKTGILTFSAPFAMRLTRPPRACLASASSTGAISINFRAGDTTMLQDPMVIGAGFLSSIDQPEDPNLDPIPQPSLAESSIADNATLRFDVTCDPTNARGLKVWLYYQRTS